MFVTYQRLPKRHRTDADRLAILHEYETTPLTQSAFLAKHGIATAKTLYDWQNRFFPPQIVLTAPTCCPLPITDPFAASDRVLALLDRLNQHDPVVQELQALMPLALDF